MFQTYDPPEPRQTGAGRVAHVRQRLVQAGLDALLVPRADEHQGEYVPASAERLKWLTGFSGSAGLAVVARNAAALFVDGRYIVQAPAQVDRHIFEVLQAPEAKLEDWLGKRLKAGDAVGFDPRLHTQAMIEDLTKGLRGRGIELVTIRGSDVAHNPVPLAYALVPASGKPELFVDRDKLSAEAGAHLAKLVKIVPDAKRAKPGARRAQRSDIAVRQSLDARLGTLRAAPKRIRLDPATASSWFFRRLKGGKATIVRG